MGVNTCLMFEVLLYLNSYYFGMFVVGETLMNIMKVVSLTLPTFFSDFGIFVCVCIVEGFRIFIARKGNLSDKVWPMFLAMILTIPCAAGILYFIIWQSCVLHLEYVLCGIQVIFHTGELIFGMLCMLPFCKPQSF